MSLHEKNFSSVDSKKAIIICGPTASGKTYFAHFLARKYNGEIINADAIQIYNNINILTDSPSLALQKDLPYHLYNFLPLEREFSLIKYVEIASNYVQDIYKKGKLPIIVGGTGMYINALVYGYNEIPPITKEVREQTRNLRSEMGQVKFYNHLIELDPLAIRLNPNDSQRVLRAYEVFTMTKQSFFAFHKKEKIIPLPDFNFDIIFLKPERQFLYSLCNKRLIDIFNNGAIDEVKFIKENFVNLASSAKKAIGMQEIINFLETKITFEEAIALAQAKTRQYAKRQLTWFNHQILKKRILPYSNIEEFEILKSQLEISFPLN